MSAVATDPSVPTGKSESEALVAQRECTWKVVKAGEGLERQQTWEKSSTHESTGCPTLPTVRSASQGGKEVEDTMSSSRRLRWGHLSNASVPALESAAPKAGLEEQAHASEVKKPAVPCRISPSGIPVERYRQKLEECASLHHQLQEMVSAHCVTQEQLCGVRAECDCLKNEIVRLRDLLATTTSELGIQQQHVVELERENLKLREELREKQVEGMTSQRKMNYILSNSTVSPQGGGVATYTRYSPRPSPATVVLPVTPTLMVQPGLTGAKNVLDAVELYVRECFRTNVLPHVELIHSLYDGGRLAAVDPPLTHAQLKALQRVLADVKWEVEVSGIPVETYVSRKPRLQGRSQRLKDPDVSYPLWFNKLETLTFRSESWRTCLGLIVEIVRSLKSARYLELFGISDASTMQQLAETLIMEQHVEALSLPEVELDDEGLITLFTLITRRDHLGSPNTNWETCDNENQALQESGPAAASEAAPNDAQTENKESASPEAGAALTPVGKSSPTKTLWFGVRCLDLSRCKVTDPTNVFSLFRCPVLEVLVLPPSNQLGDVHLRGILEGCPHLHTIDISGNTALTTACVKYIGRHSTIKVLRLENCPGIDQLDLPNVEVLFSSLSYVIKLHAPELRRLPVPVVHSRVLFNFKAPRLREITLKGIVVDRGTLDSLKETAGEDSACEPKLARSVLSSCDKSAYSDGQKQSTAATMQLLCAGFIDCTFTAESEVREFTKKQKALLRFSLHGCKGVVDANLTRLPATLMDLDVSDAARLTNRGLEIIATTLPQLIRLNLKNAGPQISNEGIRLLRGLVNLEVLNLLRLPQILPEVVSAVANDLPWLRKLYHETAVVGPRSVVAATSAPVHLDVLREDDEDTTRNAVGECAKELLQLRNETALAFWMDAQLPKPTSLIPPRTAAADSIDLNAPNPPLTANTTFYEAACRKLSRSGNGSAFGSQRRAITPRNADAAANQNEESEKVNVLVVSSGDDSPLMASMSGGVEGVNADCGDVDDKSFSTAPDQLRAMENALDEKNRLVIEKKPLGPWDEEDLVEKHRRIA
ncbi:leucine-rich repeat protein (LRRP), putative [Trypanosoma equiperdum]|nr:leucine-rich repeat protein (LRRP), putative [Trypanosoma equiperdum]